MTAYASLVRPPHFEMWLDTYFVPYGDVDSVWDRFPPTVASPEFAGTDDEIAELFTYTMRTCGTGLAGLNDRQVGNGLDNLLNNHFTSLVYSVRDGAISLERKIAALQSLKLLYRDCLTPRAAPVLGHLSEKAPCRPLNGICYMLWDVTPLSYWPDPEHGAIMYPVIVEVMESALYSENAAVVESGLHGLGHLVYKCQGPAVSAIDSFLEKRRGQIREELVTYARAARTGMIQ